MKKFFVLVLSIFFVLGGCSNTSNKIKTDIKITDFKKSYTFFVTDDVKPDNSVALFHSGTIVLEVKDYTIARGEVAAFIGIYKSKELITDFNDFEERENYLGSVGGLNPKVVEITIEAGTYLYLVPIETLAKPTGTLYMEVK